MLLYTSCIVRNCDECASSNPIDTFSKNYTDILSVTKTFVQEYSIGDTVSHSIEGAGIIVRLYTQDVGNYADVVFGEEDVVVKCPLTLLD